MAKRLHRSTPATENHVIQRWEVANAAARLALVPAAADLGGVARQADDGSLWACVGYAPAGWRRIDPDATEFSSPAYAAQLAAQAARDAAMVNGRVYVSTAAAQADGGLANGAYYSVPVSGSTHALILYRKDSGVASTEMTRYPSADAALKPSWTGKKSGWPDPFFRRFDLTSQTFLGRDRWWWNNTDTQFGGWTRVANSIFNGYALRRTAGYNGTSYSGLAIWLDEIDAAVGDTVTAYVLITGTSGTVYGGYRFDNGNDSNMITQGNLLNSAGASGITASATPTYLRVTATVPAGATRIVLYPFMSSGSVAFDLVAAWAFKGAATEGPDWPTQEDEGYYRLRDADLAAAQAITAVAVTTNAGRQIRQGYQPYVTQQSVLGDGEMDGDLDYAGISKSMGFYEQVSEATLVNAIQGRIWASDPAADVEWKVWVRDTAAGFNMSSTTAAASGTIAAADFPHSNQVYKLQLDTPVYAASGQYVFVMFRAANDTFINSRRWAYNAGVTPARHGFPFSTTNGWNTTVLFGAAASGYGQVAAKFLLESDELRLATIPVVAEAAPDLLLPPTIYATQGREISAYFDNLIAASADDYLWDVVGGPAAAFQQNERWTYNPTGAFASAALTFNLYNRRTYELLATGSTNVVAVASTAGTGTTPKCIFIGDSLTSAGVYTGELVTIAGGDAMGISLLGTQGSGSNKHEGRAGWTINLFTTTGSPFYISGAVNFPQYLTNNSIAVPDWVFIMLGINDVASQTSDAAVEALAATEFAKLDTLIASIKAAGAGVKVGLMTTTPPSTDQDAFGANYNVTLNRGRVKRNIAVWVKEMLATYAGQTANRIYLVPTHVNLDTVNNMLRAASAPVNSRSTVNVTRQSNGVHPANEGYYQIADTVWAFLKNQ